MNRPYLDVIVHVELVKVLADGRADYANQEHNVVFGFVVGCEGL